MQLPPSTPLPDSNLLAFLCASMPPPATLPLPEKVADVACVGEGFETLFASLDAAVPASGSAVPAVFAAAASPLATGKGAPDAGTTLRAFAFPPHAASIAEDELTPSAPAKTCEAPQVLKGLSSRRVASPRLAEPADGLDEKPALPLTTANAFPVDGIMPTAPSSERTTEKSEGDRRSVVAGFHLQRPVRPLPSSVDITTSGSSADGREADATNRSAVVPRQAALPGSEFKPQSQAPASRTDTIAEQGEGAELARDGFESRTESDLSAGFEMPEQLEPSARVGLEPAAAEENDAVATRASFAEGEANFADEQRERSGDGPEDVFLPDKSFLATKEQQLTRRRPTLGISSANSVTAMSNPALTLPSTHPANEYADAGVPRISAADTSVSESVSAEAVTNAQRAVEVVLHAVDRAAGREQTSVQLELSVGDDDLIVRVELRADEVRTTFRTDSAELRAALAHEWQAVTPGTGERALRLAPAEFTSAGGSGGGSFSNDTASRQHERESSRFEHRDVPHFGRNPAASSSATLGVAPRSLSSLPPAPHGTALRLNLFA